MLLLSVPGLLAASDPVRGIIIDSETKEPLPFANIVVIGLNKGTVSNAEGNFAFDRSAVPSDDTVQFSYMGYETFRICVNDLKKNNRIRLNQASINLEEVQISTNILGGREIVALAEKNYSKNHPSPPQRRELFFHNYETFPFSEENRITVNSSDFPGLDEKNLQEMFELMPDEFIEYQDIIVDFYTDGKEYKLIPDKGISLEEGSMQSLGREMETKLQDLFDDIQKSREDEDVYYQIKSGIFRQKFKSDSLSDSLWNESLEDSLHYTLKTSDLGYEIQTLIKDYSSPHKNNWEFITDRRKYDYVREEVTIYEGEFVYRISFTPRNRGLYQGNLYISTDDYGILLLDFEFADGKEGDKFNLAGFHYSEDFKKARVFFEKGPEGYHLKYINATQHESGSVERKLAVLKKQKRPLRDKVLNEIEAELRIIFNVKSTWELLVLEREEVSPQQISEADQPPFIKLRKEYAYSPEMWENRTVIVPVTKLQNYTRK